MAGHQATSRLRVGEWRIVYEVGDEDLVVLLMNISHRREAYRQATGAGRAERPGDFDRGLAGRHSR